MSGVLEGAGWLVGAWEDIDEHTEGRRRRRYYRLTGTGLERARATLADHEAALRPVWSGGLGPDTGTAQPAGT